MKKIFFAAFVLAAVPAVSSASLITFAGISDLTVLTNQNFGDGITFAGAQILRCCATDSSGSLNDDFFPPPADDGGVTDGVNVAFNASGALTLDFTTAVNMFSAAFTYDDGLTLQAYNSSSALIYTMNGACGTSGSGDGNYVGSGCGSPDEVLSLSMAGISSIVISGGHANTFTIDDVSFPGSMNYAPVPEPGSIAMMLGGLGCVTALSRGRRSAARASR